MTRSRRRWPFAVALLLLAGAFAGFWALTRPHEVVVPAYRDRSPVTVEGGALPASFDVRYEVDEAQEPWILVVFDAEPKCALWLFPRGDHSVAFAVRQGEGWGMSKPAALPESSLTPGRWSRVEVAWIGDELRCAVDGVEAFRERVGDLAPRRWHLEFLGAAREVRVRHVTVPSSRFQVPGSED